MAESADMKVSKAKNMVLVSSYSLNLQEMKDTSSSAAFIEDVASQSSYLAQKCD